MKSNKKVLLFGGSYNPIHHGHLNAALKASSQIKVDEVWLMPRRYDYDGSLLLNSKHRINMIKIATKKFANFKVCKVEVNDVNRKLVYTYNTACYLTKKYPNIDFYFLIGADQLNGFRGWFEPYKLTKLFHFVCYKRPGYEIDDNIAKEFNIQIVDGPQVDVSSTLIRKGVIKEINNNLQNYIDKHHLYLESRVKEMLPEKRYNHVISVAKLAREYAISNHVNQDKAYLAGLLHDIAKYMDKDIELELMKKYFPNKLSIGSYSYHAYISSIIAKDEFKINDKKVLSAIKYHSSASFKMSKLAKIIYCADKLEETRSFANKCVNERNLGYKDIDLCFIKTMEEQVDAFNTEEFNFDKTVLKLIDHYKRKYYGR